MSTQIPHSTQAERTILCACLIDPRRVFDVADRVDVDDWYEQRHRDIYAAILDLAFVAREGADTSVSVGTVAAALEVRGRLHNSGGAEYIESLAEYSPGLVGADSAIRKCVTTVESTARVRRLISTLADAAQAGIGYGEDADGFSEYALSAIMTATEGSNASTARTLNQVLPGVLKTLDGGEDVDKARIVRLPWQDLNDKLVDGLRPGKLYVVAARPAMGKSVAAWQMACEGAKLGKHAMFFSLEMGDAEIALRTIAAECGVHMSRLMRANLRPEDYRKITADMLDAVKWGGRLTIDDDSGVGVNAVRARARRAAARGRCDMVLVDYLQIMDGSTTGKGSRERDVSEMSRGLKLLSRELKIPVVAVSQLNRDCEKRPDKRPLLADLRESGSIEQDADAVIMLHRPAVYAAEGSDDQDDPTCEFWVRKHRGGPTGAVKLRFDGPHTRILSMDGRTS